MLPLRLLLAPILGLVALFRRPTLSIPSVLTAVLVVLSFPPFEYYPLIFVAFLPLLSVATRVTPGKAFLWGWLSGTLIVGLGFYFIAQLLVVFGQLPLSVAWGGQVLFSFYQGLGIAAFCSIISALCRDERLPLSLVAPVAIVAVEFVCRQFFIFPFHIGNAPHPFLLFIQIADLVGVLGVSAMILLVNSALFMLVRALWRGRRGGQDGGLPRYSLVITVLLVGASLVYGAIRIAQVDAVAASSPSLRVGLVEADIGIFMKANPNRVANNLLIHQQASARLVELGAELIVWPETAVNVPFFVVSTVESDDLELLSEDLEFTRRLPRNVTYFRPSEAELVADVHEDQQRGTPNIDRVGVQRGFDVPILFGVMTIREPTPEELPNLPPHGERTPTVAYNTAVLIDAQGRVLGSYDKNVLLVFGEWVPLSHFLYAKFGFNFYELVPTAGDIMPGEGVSIMELPIERDGQTLTIRIGPMVCYEDIVSSFGLRLAQMQPNMFINIINDGWFQTSSAAQHHNVFAVFRAIEHRIPMIRSTNTGVSSIIDPVGRMVASTWLVGASTRLEDSRYELWEMGFRELDLHQQLVRVESVVREGRLVLLAISDELDQLRSALETRDGEARETALVRLRELHEPLSSLGSELEVCLRDLEEIMQNLELHGVFRGEVAHLLKSSQDFIAEVNTGLPDALELLGRLESASVEAAPSTLELVRLAHTRFDRFQRQLSGPEVLLSDVPIMPPPTTLYSRIGELFAWLSLLTLLALFVVGRFKAQR